MAAKIFVLIACIALSQARLVRRDAPATSPLQELQKHAEEFQNTLTEQFTALFNSENTQKVNKALKESSDSVLQQMSVFSASLQSALGDAQGKTKEALEQARQNIEKSTAELRQAHPEIEENASALSDRIKSAIQTTVQETQKLAKEFATNAEQTNEKLAPKIKAAYDDFVKQAEEVQKKIKEAAA